MDAEALKTLNPLILIKTCVGIFYKCSLTKILIGIIILEIQERPIFKKYR